MSKKDKTLKKCDELLSRLNELKKALNSVNTVSSINVQSSRKPVAALGTGWSQDGKTGALHHGLHGVISTTAHPEGGFEIRHGGGVVGRVKDMTEAGAKIKAHVAGLGPKDTNMQNRPSPNMPTPTKMGARSSSLTKSNYSPAQLAAIEEADSLIKNSELKPWIQHNAIPVADKEVAKLIKSNPADKAENLMSNQLANMMQGRAMLGTPPPRQPTDEEMFGHLAVSEEVAKSAEQQWAGAMNNWMTEASKPISQKFASEEEEVEYWKSIKVSDRDDGGAGY